MGMIAFKKNVDCVAPCSDMKDDCFLNNVAEDMFPDILAFAGLMTD